MKTAETKTRKERASVQPALNRTVALFSGLLFLSGVAALVYQVLWVRQLSLVVGIEVYSITIAVSAFFAGLAGGGAVFGKVADRVRSPIRFYGTLELTIAVVAVATTLLLPLAAGTFVWLEAHVGILAWVLPFVLVATPAFAMGGTLPVAVQALRATGAEAASKGGMLYAANTTGGIVGALAAAFALLPWLGVRGTAIAAALLNLTASAIAWSLSRREGEVVNAAEPPRKTAATPAVPNLALALYAVAGGIALGYEVVWSQAIGQFVSTRAFSFSIVLAVYLAGLAVGSWLSSRSAGRLRDSWGVFGLLIAGAGLVSVLEFAVLGQWFVTSQTAIAGTVLAATGSQALRMYASFAVAGLGIVFIPALLLGAAFPMALRMMVGASAVGRDVGRVVAANTAGGIAGTLLTGFLLIPTLGLVRTLGMLAVSAAAVGMIAVLTGANVNNRMKWAVGAIAVTVAVTIFLTPADRLANLLMATRGGGMLVFYEESRGATVAIAQQRSKDNVFRRLFIQGVSNSGDTLPSMRYMRLQAMLPLLIHDGEPKSALVVGFGTGITAGETLRYSGLEKRVCVELLPAVVRSGQMFPENYSAWKDPRMQIRIRDGRQELLRSEEQYDVITLEPPPPSAQGVANLYSIQFYELAKKRLAPKGLFAQWLPIATQNEEDTRSLVQSFLDAFPYATLWTTELHEMLLVGSASPIRLDPTTIARRYATDTVTASLTAVGVDSPAALLATWVMGREGLDAFAAGAKPVTDDRPRIEYAPWVRSNEITRVLPELLSRKTDAPVEGSDDVLRAEIARKRGSLLNFYTAGLAAYDGDERTWEKTIGQVLAQDPENAYYSWIIGRD